jgi:hypothetical protein
MAAGGDVEVVVEVLAYPALRGPQADTLALLVQPALEPGKQERQAFAEMAEDDLDARVLVE